MAVIGIIDIAMRANVAPFLAGVGKASKSLAGFVSGAGSSGLATLGAGLESVGKHARAIGSDLLGCAGQVLKLGSIAGTVAIGGLAALAVSSLHSIDATGDLAEKLGVTGGALAAFGHAVKLTGGPVEALPEILGKLNSTLGTAATEATPAAAAIRRLGLDAKALADAGPIEATKQIADKLAAIESPAMRAAIATQIFGEQGAKLAGTFKAGAAGISALEAEARKLGVALADADYKKVADANDAIDRAGAAIAGVGNQLAVGLAPYITAAAEKFVEFATAGGGAGPIIARGLEIAGAAIGVVADGAYYLKIGFLGAQAAITQGLSGIVYGITTVGQGLEGLLNLIPGVNVSFTTTLDAIGNDLDQLASDQLAGLHAALAEPPPSNGIKTFLDDIRIAADKSAKAIDTTRIAGKGMGDALAATSFKVSELETKLKEQVATFGKSSAEIEVYKLKQAGASAEDLKRVESLSKQLKALDANKEATKKLADDAKTVIEATRTPLEKFQAEQSKLAKLFSAGLIDGKTLARGTEAAKKESGIGDLDKRAGALTADSQEARSALLSFRQQGQTGAEESQRKTADNTAKLVNVFGNVEVLVRRLVGTPGSTEANLLGI